MLWESVGAIHLSSWFYYHFIIIIIIITHYHFMTVSHHMACSRHLPVGPQILFSSHCQNGPWAAEAASTRQQQQQQH
jgi:hypothetical protein